MAFITAFVDIRGADGVSLVPQNADGTTPTKVLQLDSSMSASFTKSGDLGIVTIAASLNLTSAAILAALASTGPLVLPTPTPGVPVISLGKWRETIGQNTTIGAVTQTVCALRLDSPNAVVIRVSAFAVDVSDGHVVWFDIFSAGGVIVDPTLTLYGANDGDALTPRVTDGIGGGVGFSLVWGTSMGIGYMSLEFTGKTAHTIIAIGKLELLGGLS